MAISPTLGTDLRIFISYLNLSLAYWTIHSVRLLISSSRRHFRIFRQYLRRKIASGDIVVWSISLSWSIFFRILRGSVMIFSSIGDLLVIPWRIRNPLFPKRSVSTDESRNNFESRMWWILFLISVFFWTSLCRSRDKDQNFRWFRSTFLKAGLFISEPIGLWTLNLLCRSFYEKTSWCHGHFRQLRLPVLPLWYISVPRNHSLIHTLLLRICAQSSISWD